MAPTDKKRQNYTPKTLDMRRSLSLLSIITFIILLCGSCKKNRPSDPVSQLPPETQKGANTFGCLVDGQVFTPKGNPLSGPVIKAQYQFVNGIQTFSVSASQKQGDGSIRIVAVQGDSISLNTGTVELTMFQINGNYWGGYGEISSLNPSNNHFTNTVNRGELKITRFDPVNQIVSGTFWFDAKNATGKIVQVREGRFDLLYVK
jgi:hypothetical protein